MRILLATGKVEDSLHSDLFRGSLASRLCRRVLRSFLDGILSGLFVKKSVVVAQIKVHIRELSGLHLAFKA